MSKEVTAWGGLALFKQMLDSLSFREAAARWGLPEPQSNRGYAPRQLIEQFIVSIWCDTCRTIAKRDNHRPPIGHDGAENSLWSKYKVQICIFTGTAKQFFS